MGDRRDACGEGFRGGGEALGARAGVPHAVMPRAERDDRALLRDAEGRVRLVAALPRPRSRVSGDRSRTRRSATSRRGSTGSD